MCARPVARPGRDHRYRDRSRGHLRRGSVGRATHAVVVDRRPAAPGSLAHSVERLGLAARSVRDQMSNDTWMVLGAVERALAEQAGSPRGARIDDTQLALAQQQTLAGMLALSGVAAESMVRDAGWTLMDIGKRIERGLALSALLRATLTTVRSPDAEQTITESALVVCESSVIYRRRNLGRVSVAAVADLVLFDPRTPDPLSTNWSGCGLICGCCPARPARHVPSDWSTRSARDCAGWIPPNSSTSTTTAGEASSTGC